MLRGSCLSRRGLQERLPLSIPAGAGVWVERRLPAAASPCSQGSRGSALRWEAQKAWISAGRQQTSLVLCSAPADSSGLLWMLPCLRLPSSWCKVLQKSVGCPSAVLGALCLGGTGFLVLCRSRVGQGWPSCAGQGEASP